MTPESRLTPTGAPREGREDARELAGVPRALLEQQAFGVAILGAAGEVLASNARLAQLQRAAPAQAPWQGPAQTPAQDAGLGAREDDLRWLEVTLPSRGDGEARRLCIALEPGAERAQHLAQLGEQVTIVAHEVRNALAGLLSAFEWIVTQLPPGGPAQLLGEASARLTALSELADDLLLLGKPLQPRRESASVLRIAREAAALFCLGAGPTISVTGEELVAAVDRRLLKLLLLNLLSNAVEACPDNGHVRIALTGEEGAVCIQVRDDGPGVPPEVLDQVFQPFFTTKPCGTGLGLPVVRRIAVAHGGSVRLRCPPGGGTEVTVVLPAGPAS
ncbi:MAG: PAS domain-containing sensor histidine kinase [Planctomycetota bacterium]